MRQELLDTGDANINVIVLILKRTEMPTDYLVLVIALIKDAQRLWDPGTMLYSIPRASSRLPKLLISMIKTHSANNTE